MPEPTQTQPTAEEIAMSGGLPDMNSPAPNQPAAPAAPVAAAPAEPKEQLIYLGGRTFRNAQELATYASELERQKIILESTRDAVQAQPQPTESKKLSDLMFEDPEAFAAQVIETASRNAEQAIDARGQKKDIWTKFFDSHPDLKDNVDIVEIMRVQHYNELKDLQPADWFPKLATYARSRLSAIRGVSSGGTELPSGPAIVTGGSNGKGMPVETKAPVPMDMVSQVRALQNRNRG